MAVIEITKQNFEEEVIKSEKPVLIDFWAEWCTPCLMLSPVVDEIAEEFPEYKVCKVNVDSEGEIAQSFDVMSIPTLISFKDGKQYNKTIGVQSKEAILEILK